MADSGFADTIRSALEWFKDSRSSDHRPHAAAALAALAGLEAERDYANEALHSADVCTMAEAASIRGELRVTNEQLHAAWGEEKERDGLAAVLETTREALTGLGRVVSGAVAGLDHLDVKGNHYAEDIVASIASDLETALNDTRPEDANPVAVLPTTEGAADDAS